jgi:hypothetical protein
MTPRQTANHHVEILSLPRRAEAKHDSVYVHSCAIMHRFTRCLKYFISLWAQASGRLIWVGFLIPVSERPKTANNSPSSLIP